MVIHPGAHMNSGEVQGLHKIADSISRAIEKSTTKNVTVLLETTAGQGTVLGYRFEQLANLIDMARVQNRIGVCLDSCHVFAAGYDIKTVSGYKKTMAAFNALIGLERLKVIHPLKLAVFVYQ